jgi:molybdopterin-guanine dinucleotide biosynthesis protein A
LENSKQHLQQIQCYHAIAMPLGFILVGGASRRMRRDKALLPWYHRPVYAHLAGELAPFCSTVSLVGKQRREFEGYRVLTDFLPDMGPLGGIASALSEPGDSWRLVVSCDLPLVSAQIVEELLVHAAASPARDADIVVPESADGRMQPLCALWHLRVGEPLRRLLVAVQRDPAGDHRRLSVLRFLETLQVFRFRPTKPDMLRNVNTMRDYLAALGGHPSVEDPGREPRDSAKPPHSSAK